MSDSFIAGIACIALAIGFLEASAIYELQKQVKILQEAKKE